VRTAALLGCVFPVVLLAGGLSACVTLSPTPAHIIQALHQTPEAWVVGSPKGLAEPIVLNNKDFIWTVIPLPAGQEGAAFSRMADKHMSAALWTLESEAERTWGKLGCELALNETEFDIEGMAFMPKGDMLLAVSRNGKLYVVDTKACKRVQEVKFGKPLVCLAVDAGGERVAIGAADGSLGVFAWPFMEGGGTRLLEKVHSDEVRALVFDKVGHLYSGGFDKRIVQWLLKEGEGGFTLEKQKEFAFEAYINDFSLDAQGKTLGIALSEAKAERTLEVYKREKRGEKEPVRAGDGGALLNIETGEQKAFFAHRGTVTTAGISPDGQMLATGGFDKRILFHRQGEKAWERELGWSIRRLRFSPNGRYIWVAAWTPQNAQANKPSKPSALAYEVVFGEDAFVYASPPPLPIANIEGEGAPLEKKPAETSPP